MVCIQSILQGWLRLIFLAGFVMYENPELVFALIMVPYMYDVYLAMMLLTAVIVVVTEMAPRWYNPWWVKRKSRKLYKNLSRMKLLMLLIEYWNADKWKCTPTPFKGGQSVTYDRIKISFLVLEVVVMNIMSMSEILARILGGIIFSISIFDIIFSTDFHFGYQ
jgi:hypothetical protein